MKETINIRDIIGCFVSQAYKMHPYNEPPKINEMVKHLEEGLRKEYQTNDNYIETDRADLQVKLTTILMGCLEFRQLNISKHRWELGQRDTFDEDKYWKFKSDDPQENDFIDLDALLQNVNYEIWALCDFDKDCFLCKFAEDYGSMEPSDCEECETCSCNPRIKCNRVTHPWALLPRNSEEYQKLVADGKIKGMEL